MFLASNPVISRFYILAALHALLRNVTKISRLEIRRALYTLYICKTNLRELKLNDLIINDINLWFSPR